jgi:hypothetical protein
LEFLGHVVDGDGLHVDPYKTKIIEEWPTPQNVSELRAFLGLCNYYRKFIQGFSKIAQPLTELMGNVPWFWDTTKDLAFQTLKQRLSSPPVLSFPMEQKSFIYFLTRHLQLAWVEFCVKLMMMGD